MKSLLVTLVTVAAAAALGAAYGHGLVRLVALVWGIT